MTYFRIAMPDAWEDEFNMYFESPILLKDVLVRRYQFYDGFFKDIKFDNWEILVVKDIFTYSYHYYVKFLDDGDAALFKLTFM